MQTYKEWFNAFLQARCMEKVNGQMLFRYRSTLDEYQDLKSLLSRSFTAMGNSHWRLESQYEAALFVLYASEWWRREYEGGAWRWTHIFESLTKGPYKIDPIERSEIVELGLRIWGHRPSEDGKKYLGAIVAHGGLPLKLLARGDGAITRLLLTASRKAQSLDWDEHQLLGYFQSHCDDLVQHLRAQEIYQLLTDMVVTVLALRGKHKLAGVGNPVEVLEQVEPKWRERFPIAVDHHSVEPLLIGMVKAVADQNKMVTGYPISVARTLVKLLESDNRYALSLDVSVCGSIALDTFATAMQMLPSNVPQTFVLELIRSQRIPIAQGRQLLGGQSNTVLLAGKSRRFSDKEAHQEVLLALRSIGLDVVAPVSVPGGMALDETQPWIFSSCDEMLVLVGVGSAKVAGNTAYILIPEHFELEPHDSTSVELHGLVENLPEPRWLYKIQGNVSIVAGGDSWNVLLHEQSNTSEQFVWKGRRLWCHSSSLPVYQNVPRLYRQDDDGQLFSVADKDIQWVQAARKGDLLPNIKTHCGPVDAWLVVDGTRQRRFRMVVLPSNSSIVFKSGETECDGSVELHGWGAMAMHVDKEVSSIFSRNDNYINIEMHANGKPPAFIKIAIEWSPALPTLSINIPFPATGGRFIHSNGKVLQNGAFLTLKSASDVHVQVFARNPKIFRQYRLDLRLFGESSSFHRKYCTEVDIPLDSHGVGEIRLFEIESIIKGLFCQSDYLDAYVEINIIEGVSSIRSLRIVRYDLELVKESQNLAIPSSQIVDLSVDTLGEIDICALPLLNPIVEPYHLEQLLFENQPIGRWSAASLMMSQNPWLIYPSLNSVRQVRPTIWSDSVDVMRPLEYPVCELAIAMRSLIVEERIRDIAKVVVDMAGNIDHPSWRLIINHYKQLKHLPLSTLDYWRVIGRNQDACLVVVLKFPEDIYELMHKMRDELGVMWDLIGYSNIKKVYEDFCASLRRQLVDNSSNDLIYKIVNEVFNKIACGSEPLAMQIARIQFEISGQRSDRLMQMISKLRLAPNQFLQKIWHGEDSFLQHILFRNHVDEKNWPYFKLWKKVLREIDGACTPKQHKFMEQYFFEIVWVPEHNISIAESNNKMDVVNVPLLIGFLMQTSNINVWLHDGDNLLELRKIKAFDPAWFELCLHLGSLLSLKSVEC